MILDFSNGEPKYGVFVTWYKSKDAFYYDYFEEARKFFLAWMKCCKDACKMELIELESGGVVMDGNVNVYD